MVALLTRLRDTEFRIVRMGTEIVTKLPIERWPVVDCLIAFYSKVSRHPQQGAPSSGEGPHAGVVVPSPSPARAVGRDFRSTRRSSTPPSGSRS